MTSPEMRNSGKRPVPPTWGFVGRDRRLRYAAEAVGAYVTFVFFRLLPVGAASAIGGWVLQRLGPLATAHGVADSNIRAALPGLTAMERRQLLDGMWNNMGRVVGEYAHLSRIAIDPRRIEIVDPQNVYARAVSAGKGALVVSAHFGNWELFSLPARRAGASQFDLYRAANNPNVDIILKKARLKMVRGGLIPKGMAGMRETVSRLRRGEFIGMVVDQKTNEGIPVEFFGRQAMTTRSPAALAYRFGCPIFVALVERVNGAHFQIVIHEVKPSRSGNSRRDIERTTRAISDILETAIRRKPELWMWAHRRWRD
jgi:KDO2-lipid IV(A) lauroyltransferase